MASLAARGLDCVATLTGHKDRVWSASWHPSGNLLASASGDKTIRLWQREVGVEESGGSGDGKAPASTQPWRCAAVLEGAQSRTVRSVAWSPCGTMLAAASFDATTVIWKLRGGYARALGSDVSSEDMGQSEGSDEDERGSSPMRLLCVLEGHEHEVKSVAWSPDGAFLATSSRDKTAWVWECDAESIAVADVECMAVLVGHSQDVKCAKWRPGTNHLMTSSYDNSIRYWPFDSEEEDWPLDMQVPLTTEAHSSTVWSLAFEPIQRDNTNIADETAVTSNRFVSCDGNAKIVLWRQIVECDAPEKNTEWKVAACIDSPHNRFVYSVSWAPYTDGKSPATIASAGGDDRICVYKESGKFGSNQFMLTHEQQNAHASDVNCIEFNPANPRELVSASDDLSVKIWLVRD
eukprot:g2225.t1